MFFLDWDLTILWIPEILELTVHGNFYNLELDIFNSGWFIFLYFNFRYSLSKINFASYRQSMDTFCLSPGFKTNLCSFKYPIWTFQFEKSTVGWGTTQLSWFGLHIKSQKSLQHQPRHSPISHHWVSPFKISPKNWKLSHLIELINLGKFPRLLMFQGSLFLQKY